MSTNSQATDKLREAGGDFVRNLGDKAMGAVNDRVGDLTNKLNDLAEGGATGKAAKKAGEAALEGDNPIMGGLKGAASGLKDKVTGGSGSSTSGGDATKSTNIVESIDVGVPLSVAYNQWTEFGAFPSFMKKVESVRAEEENQISFKAQIFLSHRSWEAHDHRAGAG